MKKTNLALLSLFGLGLCYPFTLYAQKNKTFQLLSPNSTIQLTVEAGKKMQWSVKHGSESIIELSPLSLKLAGGEVLGDAAKITSSKTTKINQQINALNYKKDIVPDQYNQLVLNCKGGFGIIFRAYNDGVAYRFFTTRKDSLTIENEEAGFHFREDYQAYIPYVNDPHNNDVFETSFENNYQHIALSKVKKDTLAFAPILVELPNNKKAVITEVDLEEYPGMFLQASRQGYALQGKFAPYPLEEKKAGHNNLQAYVMKRANYIAKTAGTRSFPWRTVIISATDAELLNNDMVYKLASPSRIKDPSWIKPGKVAWDWWNDWNITNVNFQAGINTATYKYYIDFAAKHKIENILLDEGWADSQDIMKIVPEINLQEIVDYGKSKNVGVWLWGGWLPLDQKMDLALSTYSKMGIKGFKIDFMDRDDQKMVNFFYRFAQKAAEYKIMLDYHGAYKPTGLQRTYPNVLNFEGVRGLENVKWSNTDFPLYDCTIPFIRMIAGPMDYTPGAMINANKGSFRAINSSPMSQGTRCHQLAMYVIFEAPFEMLCDNPTNYMREEESTRFITSIPTTFDQTVALDGKVSEYCAIARKKKDIWYVGTMTNWTPRDILLDLSFLGAGNFEAEIFKDGVNADRNGIDYKREVIKVSSKDKLKIHMAGGGGWTARIYPVK
ncbi:glycoside hydrolase family 97 protein [Cytophagaceae bacterium DM2B3-1]|uniref:Glycoside hydrolase family 97 protein n=1 Tax=Xanthocytophaga flava TaxID=3048013 RepID=A0ABT7CQI3_9BACT|nr:glycoside hydrolase family 97 protein [Xanthocytophaga flavus]MDJ1496004.1 glycoside hydrolase family 97 protein [Xanthocytophaga flavus]